MAVTAKRRGRRKKKAKFPLKQILAKYGWSQLALGRAIGMPGNYVNRLANDRTLPGWEVVMRIATAVGADLGDFMPQAPQPKAVATNGKAVSDVA